jgi:hypothetical protein
VSESRTVMYTAVFGTRDKLQDPPVMSSGTDYVCFSDRPQQSVVWKTRRVPVEDGSPRRTARRYKVLGHRWFPEYRYSVWVDANVEPLVPVSSLIARYLDSADLALHQHYQRDCLYREADVCRQRNLDDPLLIDGQMARYRQEAFPERFGLHETMVLLRRNTPEVREFSERWWREVETGSLRDQLSFDYVRWQTGQNVAAMTPGVRSSPDFMFRSHARSYRHSQ